MEQEIHVKEVAERSWPKERKMKQKIHVEEVAEEGPDEDAWMNDMRERLVFGSDGPKHKKHLIYRVHSDMRKGKASCYEPIATSIGPYHYGKKHLLDMETHKKRYFRHLLFRNKNVKFERLVSMMKESEQRVRGCYPEIIDLQSNAFVEMMLLDSCFIVELLLKSNYGHGDDDLFVGPAWRRVSLRCRDLILLENQLPFFLLQEIFEVVMQCESDPLDLVKLSLKYLKFIDFTETLNKEVLPMCLESVHHLLHLWHMQLIPFPAKQPQDSIPAKQPQDSRIQKLMHLIRIPAEQLQDSKILKCNNLSPCLCMCDCCRDTTHEDKTNICMPSVTQLEEAGVKFTASSSNVLDIKFCNGEMIIPTIDMLPDTEIWLRNLIAFEQCCLVSSDQYFSSYACFMYFLMNTPKDAEILRKNRILATEFCNDEGVAGQFAKLTDGVIIPGDDYLSDIYKRIKVYSSRKIHKWRASLVRDYFYSPWAVLSFMAAIVALTLTAISTLYSIKSFNNDLHQPK